jgi:hypothetical protein
MSAAEPADPMHPRTVNAGRVGDVIDITNRRRRGARTPAKGRGKAMTAPPPGPASDRPDASPLALFASDIEISFNAINQSLTDPRTAAAFLATLDVWQKILEGSHANGHIGDEELAKLTATLEGMRQAPGLV